MKKILLFAGSNHSNSIHYQLLDFVKPLLDGHEVTYLDMRNWNIPVYSIDMDPDETPKEISELIELLKDHEACLLASPEHNGGPSAFMKNILDWLSRRTEKAFDDTSVMLMSTSEGPKAAANQLNYIEGALPYQGATITGRFSLPNFSDHFKDGKLEGEYLAELKKNLQLLTA